MTPLGTTQVQSILSRVTYKFGWELTLTEDENPSLCITAWLEDSCSHNPGDAILVDIHSQLPPFYTESEVLRWLRWRLRAIEVHEVDEFLRLDGKAVFDPHRDVKCPVKARREKEVDASGRRTPPGARREQATRHC